MSPSMASTSTGSSRVTASGIFIPVDELRLILREELRHCMLEDQQWLRDCLEDAQQQLLHQSSTLQAVREELETRKSDPLLGQPVALGGADVRGTDHLSPHRRYYPSTHSSVKNFSEAEESPRRGSAALSVCSEAPESPRGRGSSQGDDFTHRDSIPTTPGSEVSPVKSSKSIRSLPTNPVLRALPLRWTSKKKKKTSTTSSGAQSSWSGQGGRDSWSGGQGGGRESSWSGQGHVAVNLRIPSHPHGERQEPGFASVGPVHGRTDTERTDRTERTERSDRRSGGSRSSRWGFGTGMNMNWRNRLTRRVRPAAALTPPDRYGSEGGPAMIAQPSIAVSEMAREEWSQHLQTCVRQDLDRMEQKKVYSITRSMTSKHLKRRAWKMPHLPKLRSCVESAWFQGLTGFVIVVNVFFIGFCTNMSMQNQLAKEPRPDPPEFRLVNFSFTAFYCLELLLRILAHGAKFVNGPDSRWNMFDSVLVFFSLIEESTMEMEGGIDAFRVCRGLRMFRVLRIVRVIRSFKDLRLMLSSILQSLGSLSWAMLLLLTIMYLFSVVFMQGAVMWLTEHPPGTVEGEDDIKAELELWYSSVLQTMYSLLASILGGVSWVELVRPLEHISSIYRVLFSFYVVFVVVGVLNVLTGIFVERACELSNLDKELVIQSQLKRNEAFLWEMKRIFEEADTDGSGTIAWNEFRQYMENDKVKAYLASQQLDAYDARTLFDIIRGGQGGNGVLTVENFIVGCQRLKGMAKEVDLLAVLQETRAVRKALKSLSKELGSGASKTSTLLTTPRGSSVGASSSRGTAHGVCKVRSADSSDDDIAVADEFLCCTTER